ncbi:OLC1v1023619C1 [Oldenlandia corymbosa var. corymbosa]|uniref:non-specific serine/threonine protein kinase n=1 Tax=Oldenlandia corymbosa var. corymbosa TaxID=529605 RepID=A0AAV1C0C0_OLDCO|nr:OLC1v1023619C1 [Oldenlandia corymbosa var. corymbosa]
MLPFLIFCFHFIFFCFFSTSVSAATPAARLHTDEVNVLKEIGRGLGKKDWDFSIDPCSGKGSWSKPPLTKGIESSVTCDCSFDANSTCHITSIALKGQNLSGVVPPGFAKLRYLAHLDLSRNYLTGSIPPQWASMNLIELSFMGNLLSGPFPTVMTRITTLVNLSIEGNQFSGPIPPQIANLVNLQKMTLSSNQFSGEVPVALSKLTNLTDLRISDNNFTGRIPDFISSLKNLEKLHIQGCSLSGPIPSSISSLTSLSDLRISDLKGQGFGFPPVSNMESMKILILRKCSISGEIPAYIGTMRKLKTLDLSFNNLTGEIPVTFVQLEKVDFMYLTGNKLTGTIPNWILSRNNNVDVSNNNFTWGSSSPSECLQGSVNLAESFSANEKFGAGVQPCLKQNIPCSQATKLQRYSLHINCGGKGLVTENNTRFEADLEARGASMYYMGQNWAFSSTGNFLDNDVDSDVYIHTNATPIHNVTSSESELYTTARASPLSLTYYGTCLMDGSYTVKLHFAEIVFTNDGSFNSLGRRIFDVYLQEKLVLKDFNIAKEAGGTGKPIVKNFNVTVTNHTLKIHFYWDGRGTTGIPVRGVYGPLISGISVDPNFEPPSFDDNKFPTTEVLAIVAGALFVVLLILGILYRKGYLGNKVAADKDLRGLDLQTGLFTLRQIKAATKNFDPANKLGEGGFGSVYKGELSDGTIIAVKQLSSKSKQGNREFVNEVGMISALQHPNLVKLYGCCIEGNQLMLIYEYMENNCLSGALFGKNSTLKMKLDWPTRRRICLDVARGLAYLHEESRLKIVHRDIKTSNILLNKDLSAKISDFGLAKLSEDDHTHISTRVAGTIGYMAPEYAMRGYLTPKADVYSYGVVALEVVSGKSNTNYRPQEECFYLLDWAYVLQERSKLLELVDPDLGSEYATEEATTILNVALLCTNAAPTLRPIMSQVVSMLEGQTDIQDILSEPGLSMAASKLGSSTIRSHFWQHSPSRSQTRSMSTSYPYSNSSASNPDAQQEKSLQRIDSDPSDELKIV